MYSYDAKEVKRYLIGGIIFVAIVGTLGHFVYGWSGQNKFVGLFFPVNESIWEHMKLIFFPMLLFIVFMRNKIPMEVVPLSFLAGSIGTWSLPVMYYVYSGILGKNIQWVDIGLFYIAVLLVFGIIHWVLSGKSRYMTIDKIEAYCPVIIFFVVLMLALFMAFSVFPPELGIFEIPN